MDVQVSDKRPSRAELSLPSEISGPRIAQLASTTMVPARLCQNVRKMGPNLAAMRKATDPLPVPG